MNEHLVRPHPAPLTPANAVITDPAHRCRLDGCRVQIIGRAPTADRITALKLPDDATRHTRQAEPEESMHLDPWYYDYLFDGDHFIIATPEEPTHDHPPRHLHRRPAADHGPPAA